MAENPDSTAGDNEKALSGAAKPHESKSVDSNLPMVIAPKLGAGDEALDETVDEPAEEAAASSAPAHSTRFLVLAATVAFAAAFGSFIGSVSGSGLARFIYPGEPGAANTVDAMREMKLDLAALSVIKSDLDSASHNTTSQFAKIADRLDKLDQRTAMASDTTGSIAGPTNPLPAATPITPAAPKLTDRILQDWVVQDVQNGRALVESRYGGIFDVGAGSTLPGIGRVDTIKRQDGQWLVLTERGTITSGR
jgi:hypothetical protein